MRSALRTALASLLDDARRPFAPTPCFYTGMIQMEINEQGTRLKGRWLGFGATRSQRRPLQLTLVDAIRRRGAAALDRAGAVLRPRKAEQPPRPGITPVPWGLRILSRGALPMPSLISLPPRNMLRAEVACAHDRCRTRRDVRPGGARPARPHSACGLMLDVAEARRPMKST